VIDYNTINIPDILFLGVHSFISLTLTPAWIKEDTGRVNSVALKNITQRPQQRVSIYLM